MLCFTLALTGCDQSTIAAPQPSMPPAKPVADARAVAEAQRKCDQAAKEAPPRPMITLPVEKFDDCIAEEANKWPMETRQAICALGRSGGEFRSPVEVYMHDGICRTDYE